MKNEFDYLNDVKIDFSLYGEEILSEKEIKRMKQSINTKKKKISMKKLYVLAACVAITAVTGTAFATGFVDNIIKSVSTGQNTFIQTDDSVPQELPADLQGKLFDKNGVQLSRISVNDIDDLYDENGNKLDRKALEDLFSSVVNIVSEDEEKSIEDSQVFFADLDDAQENASFDIKVPEYLPEGYSLSSIYGYKTDDGSASGDYRVIEYKNEKGKMIYFHERILNDETRFTTSTDGSLDELLINGNKAVLMDDKNLDWETEDHVSVGIMVDKSIDRDELIKIGESVK